METIRNRWLAPLAALALASACGGGGGSKPATTPPDEEAAAAWMDGALVQVALDPGRKRETVTLVDAASGHAEQMDDEPLDDGVVEVAASE